MMSLSPVKTHKGTDNLADARGGHAQAMPPDH